MYQSARPLTYQALDLNNPAKRSELVEFRNYVRQTAYAKLEHKEEPKTIFSKTMHQPTRSLMTGKPLFVQSKVYVEQTQPSARGLTRSPFRDFREQPQSKVETKVNRSSSQSFVQFDANTWKENQNSFSRDHDRNSQSAITVADIIKLNNRLNMIPTKEVKELSTSYMHSIQELEQTITAFLKKIDLKII